MKPFDIISDDLARMAAAKTVQSDPDLLQQLLGNFMQGGATIDPLTTNRSVGSNEFVDAEMRPGPGGQSYSRNMAVVPRVWKSAPDHEPAALIYATEREIDMLREADIYGSGIDERMHYGPQHVPSLQGDGIGGVSDNDTGGVSDNDTGGGGGTEGGNTPDNSIANLGGWAANQGGGVRAGPSFTGGHEADADTESNRSFFEAAGLGTRSFGDRVADFLASFFGLSRTTPTFDEVENKFDTTYKLDIQNVPALYLGLMALNPVLGVMYGMQQNASLGRPAAAALQPLSLVSPFAGLTNSLLSLSGFNVDAALGTQSSGRTASATATESQSAPSSPTSPTSRDDAGSSSLGDDNQQPSSSGEASFRQVPTTAPGTTQLFSPELSPSTTPSDQPSIVYGVAGGPGAQPPAEPGAFRGATARFGSYKSSSYGGFK